MLSASRDTRTIGHGDDTAAIALCALRNLNHAVAVIDPGGRILFENSTFSQLFAGEAWASELLDWISAAMDGVDRTRPREISRRDGRIFSVETVRVLGVHADELKLADRVLRTRGLHRQLGHRQVEIFGVAAAHQPCV